MRNVLKQQNEYYHKQFEVMDSLYKNTKSVRHDIKKHLAFLKYCIENGENKRASEYIGQIIDTSYNKNEFAKSGNIVIDSILNFKIQEAAQKDINVNLSLQIPDDLILSDFDMVVVLGNLLDNAINASGNLENNRKININIKYKSSMLFIHVSNTFDGHIMYRGDKIVTSNEDKENHGIGLNNIKSVIDKYDGVLKIQHTENIFYADILMYVD